MKIELSSDCDPYAYTYTLRGFVVRIDGEDYEIRDIDNQGLWVHPVDEDGRRLPDTVVTKLDWEDIDTIYVY